MKRGKEFPRCRKKKGDSELSLAAVCLDLLRRNARAARQHVQRHALAQQHLADGPAHRGAVLDGLEALAFLQVPLDAVQFLSDDARG